VPNFAMGRRVSKVLPCGNWPAIAHFHKDGRNGMRGGRAPLRKASHYLREGRWCDFNLRHPTTALRPYLRRLRWSLRSARSERQSSESLTNDQ
jgi:hypothetical protein